MRGATSWQLLASKKQCNYVRHSCYIIVPLAAIVEVQKLRFPTVSGGQLHGDGCVHEIQVNAVLERVCHVYMHLKNSIWCYTELGSNRHVWNPHMKYVIPLEKTRDKTSFQKNTHVRLAVVLACFVLFCFSLGWLHLLGCLVVNLFACMFVYVSA